MKIMSKITFNFEEPESNELIPDGTELNARVHDVELGLSQSGNERFKLKVKALDENGDAIRTIPEYLTMTEKAKWKVEEFLWSTGYAKEAGQVKLSEEALMGLEGRIRVNQYTFEDSAGVQKVTNGVDRWLAPTK